MNRKILAAVGAAALSASLAFGGAVDQSMATVAAERFVSCDGVGALLLAGRTAMPAEKRGSLWIVRLAPSGYVVVQGSDKAEPVVTFSTEDWTEPEEGSTFFEMLRGASEACAALEADAAAAENPKWSALAANRPRLQDSMPAGATFMVEPFMTAHWHQKHPYSDYTPLEWPCGCKATATGQELAHWKWPWRPEFTRLVAHPLIDHSAFRVRLDGNEPFDWDNVFDSYSAVDMQSRANRHAAGRLVLWCQSLVNMHFMNGGASFRLEGDGAVFDVKVIAGLWYSVKYGMELSRGNVGGAAGTTGAVQAAETGVKTITAPRCGERGFYKLIVAPADD